MEAGQSSLRRRENVHLSCSHLRLLGDQEVSLLLHGRNRRGFGLQKHYLVGSIHHLEEIHSAYCHQPQKEHVPGVQQSGWNLQGNGPKQEDRVQHE